MEDYKIQLRAFEGPMDLLMHLIEKNKIDIYDIPIAELTEQYMAYLGKFRQFNIDVASEFLVMAATLLLIKSRLMLPEPPPEESAAEGEDPRRELVERILAYQQYKRVSMVLADMAEQQRRYVARPPLGIPVKRLPPENLSVESLWNVFRSLLAVRQELAIPEVIVAHEAYRVEEQMAKIMQELSTHGGQLSFSELFPGGTRDELIADFLALLELIRRKYIVVQQEGLFSAITIQVRSAATASISEGSGETLA